ncbi:NIPSNAP family protein [Streptomyces halstedii]|uniref:NIPSNAP family protein n=1 Tax=Streptomyces TaxID=1883 RepID=UPI0004A8C7A1|nr:NIPSNAP family protein [Streptomyces sp. NTK 937]KDQ71200.1 hypothetical protein DT87_29575 [Streptomyces sp. NTK 937]WSX34399.1 NIPSNAP family protein [Streptomyces halstedii]
MITEFRRYRATAGDLPDLTHRFAHVVTPLFSAHGFRVEGAWTPTGPGPAHELLYAVGWSDEEAMADGWRRFKEDPAWERARETPRYSGLRPDITSTTWTPAEFLGTRP